MKQSEQLIKHKPKCCFQWWRKSMTDKYGSDLRWFDAIAHKKDCFRQRAFDFKQNVQKLLIGTQHQKCVNNIVNYFPKNKKNQIEYLIFLNTIRVNQRIDKTKQKQKKQTPRQLQKTIQKQQKQRYSSESKQTRIYHSQFRHSRSNTQSICVFNEHDEKYYQKQVPNKISIPIKNSINIHGYRKKRPSTSYSAQQKFKTKSQSLQLSQNFMRTLMNKSIQNTSLSQIKQKQQKINPKICLISASLGLSEQSKKYQHHNINKIKQYKLERSKNKRKICLESSMQKNVNQGFNQNYQFCKIYSKRNKI